MNFNFVRGHFRPITFNEHSVINAPRQFTDSQNLNISKWFGLVSGLTHISEFEIINRAPCRDDVVPPFGVVEACMPWCCRRLSVFSQCGLGRARAPFAILFRLIYVLNPPRSESHLCSMFTKFPWFRMITKNCMSFSFEWLWLLHWTRSFVPGLVPFVYLSTFHVKALHGKKYLKWRKFRVENYWNCFPRNMPSWDA